MFVQEIIQAAYNSKLNIIGESTSDWRIPSTKGQQGDKHFRVMV